LNTGINTGIPVLIFSNTEILVLGNRAGIAGSSPIHTSWLICAASMHKRLAHFNHATLYTSTVPENPFLALSTLY